MKRITLLLVSMAIIGNISSQNTSKKVETKYFRPSVTTLFVEPKTTNEKTIISKFNTLPMVPKFDEHKIEFPMLSGIVTNDYNNSTKMNNYIRLASNPILAKWWNRDAEGNFDAKYVAERGSYTASDADAVITKGSNTNRIEMLGEKLINKSYALLYEISELITMEEYYDKVDASNKKKSDYTPVKRTDEGFMAKYNVYAYKLNFNDSVAAVFYNNYWVDVKNQDKNKVANWKSATFPMKYITKVTGSMQITQPKDPKSSSYTAKNKKKTSAELLEELPEKWQADALFELGKKIEDFHLKVTVFKTYPVTAKLGTKEDIYTDQRFYVYELEVDKKGNQKANRMGVVRAKKIVDNKKTATGYSKPSTFQQVNGKRLYEGMFMESKDDYGIILNIGSNSSTNKSVGGFNIGADIRLSRFTKTPGLHLGIDVSFNSMKNINPGKVETTTHELTSDESKWSGSTMALAVNLGKEMYFTDKGNVYLKPSIGIGLTSYTFDKYDDDDLSTIISGFDKKDYDWSALYFPLSIGLGWNIAPSISLEWKPGIYLNLAAKTGNNESLMQNSSSYTDGWGFKSIGETGYGIFNILNLRVRF